MPPDALEQVNKLVEIDVSCFVLVFDHQPSTSRRFGVDSSAHVASRGLCIPRGPQGASAKCSATSVSVRLSTSYTAQRRQRTGSNVALPVGRGASSRRSRLGQLHAIDGSAGLARWRRELEERPPVGAVRGTRARLESRDLGELCFRFVETSAPSSRAPAPLRTRPRSHADRRVRGSRAEAPAIPMAEHDRSIVRHGCGAVSIAIIEWRRAETGPALSTGSSRPRSDGTLRPSAPLVSATVAAGPGCRLGASPCLACKSRRSG